MPWWTNHQRKKTQNYREIFDCLSITFNLRYLKRPRFAGKCDQQSRYLTQLTSGYISRSNRQLITPDHHVRTHTWKSIAQQIFNGEYEYFLSFTRNRSRIPLHPSRTRSPLSYVSYKYDMYHVISCLACEVHGSSIFRDQKLSK